MVINVFCRGLDCNYYVEIYFLDNNNKETIIHTRSLNHCQVPTFIELAKSNPNIYYRIKKKGEDVKKVDLIEDKEIYDLDWYFTALFEEIEQENYKESIELVKGLEIKIKDKQKIMITRFLSNLETIRVAVEKDERYERYFDKTKNYWENELKNLSKEKKEVVCMYLDKNNKCSNDEVDLLDCKDYFGENCVEYKPKR